MADAYDKHEQRYEATNMDDVIAHLHRAVDDAAVERVIAVVEAEREHWSGDIATCHCSACTFALCAVAEAVKEELERARREGYEAGRQTVLQELRDDSCTRSWCAAQEL